MKLKLDATTIIAGLAAVYIVGRATGSISGIRPNSNDILMIKPTNSFGPIESAEGIRPNRGRRNNDPRYLTYSNGV